MRQLRRSQVTGTSASRNGWSAQSAVLVIEGVLVGLSGVFLATASLAVTTLAAIAAVILTTVIIVAGR